MAFRQFDRRVRRAARPLVGAHINDGQIRIRRALVHQRRALPAHEYVGVRRILRHTRDLVVGAEKVRLRVRGSVVRDEDCRRGERTDGRQERGEKPD